MNKRTLFVPQNGVPSGGPAPVRPTTTAGGPAPVFAPAGPAPIVPAPVPMAVQTPATTLRTASANIVHSSSLNNHTTGGTHVVSPAIASTRRAQPAAPVVVSASVASKSAASISSVVQNEVDSRTVITAEWVQESKFISQTMKAVAAALRSKNQESERESEGLRQKVKRLEGVARRSANDADASDGARPPLKRLFTLDSKAEIAIQRFNKQTGGTFAVEVSRLLSGRCEVSKCHAAVDLAERLVERTPIDDVLTAAALDLIVGVTVAVGGATIWGTPRQQGGARCREPPYPAAIVELVMSNQLPTDENLSLFQRGLFPLPSHDFRAVFSAMRRYAAAVLVPFSNDFLNGDPTFFITGLAVDDVPDAGTLALLQAVRDDRRYQCEVWTHSVILGIDALVLAHNNGHHPSITRPFVDMCESLIHFVDERFNEYCGLHAECRDSLYLSQICEFTVKLAVAVPDPHPIEIARLLVALVPQHGSLLDRNPILSLQYKLNLLDESSTPFYSLFKQLSDMLEVAASKAAERDAACELERKNAAMHVAASLN